MARISAALPMTVLVASLIGGCGEDVASVVESPGDPIRDGRLIDASVSGVHYVTASRSGTTSADGRFEYLAGERISFYLSDSDDGTGPHWKLGDTLGRDVITPLELAGATTIDDRVINLLRLLQTLDDDLDPGNGIVVALDRENMPDGALELDLSQPVSRFAVDPSVLHFIEQAANRTALVDAVEAIDHFQENLNELFGDPTGDWVLQDASVRGDGIEGLEASLRFDGQGRYSARARWPQGDASIDADFEIDGLWLNSRIAEANAEVGSHPQWNRSWGSGAPADLDSAPVPLAEHVLIALGVRARVRVLPNLLTLESADGEVVLRYVRGDPIDGLPVAFLEVAPHALELATLGAEARLQAEAFTAAAAVVPETRFSWHSSDPSVATVDADGLVIAVAEGSTVVRVDAAGAETSVRVDVVLADVAVDGSDAGAIDSNDSVERETSCDDDGTVVSRSDRKLSQINETDADQGQAVVEQQNTSTIEQRSGEVDDACAPSTDEDEEEEGDAGTPESSGSRSSPDPAARDRLGATDSTPTPDVAHVPTDVTVPEPRDLPDVAGVPEDEGWPDVPGAAEVANVWEAVDLPDVKELPDVAACLACAACPACPACLACTTCAGCSPG